MDRDSVIKSWNNQADEYNQWDSLGEDEKIEFSIKLARKEALEEVESCAMKAIKRCDASDSANTFITQIMSAIRALKDK